MFGRYSLKELHTRFNRRAFTLIELLVVIVILALLMAIAIPAYLSQQAKAKDAAAKTYMATSLRSARGELVSNSGSSGYPVAGTLSALLGADQPQITYVVGGQAAVTSGKMIAIDPTSGGKTLILYAKSDSGNVWKLDADATSASDKAHFSNLGSATTAYALSLGAGNHTFCAVMSDGKIKCWGSSGYSQLGNGSVGGINKDAPTLVTGISNASQVVGGYESMCALLSTGSVKCWGANSYNELGDGSGSAQTTPVSVTGISTATQIASSDQFAYCALLGDKTVKCWGYGTYGQMGNGGSSASNTPSAVTGLSNVVSIGGGGDHFCAVISGGALKCWGYNYLGEAGDQGTGGCAANKCLVPVASSGLAGTVTNMAGGQDHTCVLLNDGTVHCVGNNAQKQTGNATGGSNWSTATGVSSVLSISSLYFHTCAVITGGSIKCWGWNYYGQMGNGVTDTVGSGTTAVSVSGISNAVSVTTGEVSSCAILADHSVKCWGYNGTGDLDNGSTIDSNIPVLTGL
jgi:prepilin-type N-terminal cleavage/methylation domain-containing protein